MFSTFILASLAVFLALLFDFTNGFHDSANQVATVIKVNAMKPYRAMAIAAICDFIGAFFLGTAVAETLGKGIIDPAFIKPGTEGILVIVAALCSAIFWNFWTWKFGIPSSSSHALIGGLIGAFVAGWGFDPLNWNKVWSIFVGLLISPLIGLIIAFGLTTFVIRTGGSYFTSSKLNYFFKKSQYVTLICQSLAHGTNDAQKTMGVIVFILIAGGIYSPLPGAMIIPKWVILASASAISIGIFFGGWRIIRTLGWDIYDIKPVHSFVSQFSSAGIIYSASFMGLPISTTQVISSSVMGAGAADHPKLVHWEVAKDMGRAWLMTIPASATISAATLYLFKGYWWFAIGLVALIIVAYVLVKNVNILHIMPESKDFKKMLLDQCKCVVLGMEKVCKYCDEPTEQNMIAVEIAEKEADKLHDEVVKGLRSTIVAGDFDRPDLEDLSQRLDDIIDCGRKTVNRMRKLEVVPDEYIREMAGHIENGTSDLMQAVRALNVNGPECDLLIRSARKRENAVQYCYDRAFISVFENVEATNGSVRAKDILPIVQRLLNRRQIYDNFTETAEHLVSASLRLEKILAKIS